MSGTSALQNSSRCILSRNDKNASDYCWKKSREPVEVGSLLVYPIIYDALFWSQAVIAGFLNHQQYHQRNSFLQPKPSKSFKAANKRPLPDGWNDGQIHCEWCRCGASPDIIVDQNKANSKQQTVSCFWVWGVWKSFWGRRTTWFSSSGYNSTVTKSARKHGEWIACLHKPYPISHIHHVSASVRTNLLRSESHFQPFKAVPSSRKRSVASKAGQNVTTWKKDETCCQEWGTEYCQRLPTGLADNGVAISLISGYAKGNFYL